MLNMDPKRLSKVKQSFATRRLPLEQVSRLDAAADDLEPGDVVLARVDEISQHKRIEHPDGRRAILFPGDEVILACGARYAPDQFEADCPSQVGPAHLAAAGGVAGVVRESHDRMRPATEIEILGALCDPSGRRINLRDFAIAPRGASAEGSDRLTTLAVCGTSMNAGKTFTAASLVRGLSAGGRKVAAVKLTGTGAGGDLWQFKDAGAHWVADFTDAGFATTYRVAVSQIASAAGVLIAEARARGAESVVIEIADGLGQQETAGLLRSEAFRRRLSGVIFAAGDALGAAAGVSWLRTAGHDVRAVSGLLARAPLAVREVGAMTDAPCLAPQELWVPSVAASVAGIAPGVVPLRAEAA